MRGTSVRRALGMRNGIAQSPSHLRFALRGAQRLSRREIAEMLGLTEETVSRVMADFARKKIIGNGKGFIRILDRKWLEETILPANSHAIPMTSSWQLPGN
ncbi:MAG: helix-turn-helix domain-containing protein [Sulfuricaulis sp.]|nr:helix-turn-helix domain-containing protein [Sulfuricaulis sp.]